MERQRNAQVVSIAYDDPQCGWRVRFRVPRLWRNYQWSTVRTEPPLDVRCTRFAGKFLELTFFDEPDWAQGDEVTLTLEPFKQETAGAREHPCPGHTEGLRPEKAPSGYGSTSRVGGIRSMHPCFAPDAPHEEKQ